MLNHILNTSKLNPPMKILDGFFVGFWDLFWGPKEKCCIPFVLRLFCKDGFLGSIYLIYIYIQLIYTSHLYIYIYIYIYIIHTYHTDIYTHIPRPWFLLRPMAKCISNPAREGNGTWHDLDRILFLPIEPKTVFLVFDMASETG